MPTPTLTRTTRRLATALVVLGTLASVFLYTRARAATSYTWNQTGTASWVTSTNWTPTRTTPAVDDVLVFNNGATTTVTNVPTQTIGQLLVSGNTTVNLQAAAAATLTIAGGTGTDLDVQSGSALNCNTINAITIAVGTGATGSISGSMTFSASASTAHRLTAADASGITFNNGSSFTAGTNFSGSTFGTTSLNSVIFTNGSTFNQVAGSNPFGASAPSSVVIFQTGSLYKVTGASVSASFSGRTYSNVEFAGTGTSGMTGGSAVVMDNLTVTSGIVNIGMTGTPGHAIKGNISVASGATLNFNPASAGTMNLSGTAAQTISNSGTLTAASANQTFDIANTNGVTLNSAQTFTGPIVVDAGAKLATSVTLTANGAVTVNGNFQINQGGFATGSGTWTYASTGTLVFNNSSGSYGVNNDVYWPTTNGPQNVNVKGAGGITLNVARTVSGLFQYAAGVTNAGNLTIGTGGTSQVNVGGFMSSSPTYSTNTLLKYNTGTTYGRNGEWLAVTSGAGYPYNVQVSGNTTLDIANGITFNTAPSQMAGNLTIDSGSTLTMVAMTQPLTVIGNVTNNGTLTLSTSLGGDLHLQGSLTISGTYTHNNRAVFFEGAATQTVNDNVHISGGVFTLTTPYVRINKTAGTVRMLTALTALGTAGGDSIQFANGTSTLTLNGQRLTLGSTVGAAPSGAGLIGDTTGAHLDLEDGGTAGAMGTVTFVGGSQQVTTLTVNRTGGSGSVTFGTPLFVNTALNLTSGVVNMGANTLSVGTFASCTRTGGYIVGTEQKSFANTSSFTFDVGTANGYTPVDANSTVATGTGSLTVTPTQTKHPSISGTNALARYWTLAGSNITTNLTFHYLAGDVAGTESNYKIFKYTGGAFTQFTPTALDTTNHTATLNGVSSFSDWTLAEAASVFGTVQFSSATYSTAEGDSGSHNVTITVTRTVGSSGAVSVHYATSDGTATTANSDYTATSGDLNWGDADTAPKTFDVSVNGDTNYEGNETVNLALSSPTGGATLGTPSSSVLTVTNDDAPPAILVVNTTADTDDGFCLPAAGGCTLREALNAANSNSDTSTINFNIPNTDANFSGGVYTIRPTTALPTLSTRLTIDGTSQTTAGGNTNAAGPEVVVNGSLLPSGTNAFTVSANNCILQGLVINASNAALGGAASGTQVLDNYIGTDPTGTTAVPNTAVGLSFGAGSSVNVSGNLISGNSGDGITACDVTTSTFANNKIGTDRTGTSSLGNTGSGIATFCTTFANNIINGNTIAFNAQDGFRDLPDFAGTSHNHVNNRFTQNSFFSNGALGINLNPPPDGTNDGVTPNDNQDPDVGSNNLQNYPVITSSKVTGVTKTITGTLNTTPGGTGYVIEFFSNTVCDGTNGEGKTYLGNVFTGNTDANGDVSFTFHPTTLSVGDVITATATDPNNNTSEFSACTTTVAGTPGTLQFSSATYSTAEGNSGSHNVTVTVTRAGGSDSAVAVQYVTSDGTATAGSDYTPLSDGLVWTDGDASPKTFNVPINGDVLYEGNETFDITLNAPSGATLGTPSTATVTITNDDTAPTLSVGDVTVAEPSSGITYAVFPVTLSAASGLTTTVNFATADGTAFAPGDYTALSGTLSFAPGETSKTVAVIVKADAVSEPSETFSLNLSSPSNATVNDGTGVATITAPVGPGTVIISEFRLRGPGDPNAAPIDMDQPVVAVNPSPRKGRRPVADNGESDATPTATPVTIGGGIGGGPNAPPFPPETDEFIEIYNNTDADIVVTDANPATCAAQVATLLLTPAQACGWALVDLQGSVSSIPRFVIPVGTTIPARGHYLAASTGYSLSALTAPDQTYSPPLYSGGEADYTGLALFKTADRAQFTQSNVFDAVGFEGVAPLFREGSGLLPASGVTDDVQFSFVRNQTSSRPSDTGDNRADFTLVATTPSLLLSGPSTLGAPGPENTTSLVSRNSGFAVSFPPNVASSLRNNTTVSNGSLGTLSLRRRFTNNTGQTLSKLRFRVVQLTTYGSKQLFANQAEVRLLDAQLAGLPNSIKATTVETPPAQTSGGGVNSGLLVSGSLTLAQPLASGQSVDVEFLLGVMQSGSYQFVVVVEAAP
jgi:CSLREA domain-containing protein